MSSHLERTNTLFKIRTKSKLSSYLVLLTFFLITSNYLYGQDNDSWVKDIRFKYTQIRTSLESYDSTKKDLWDESTEGGIATAYYDFEDLKLIEVVWFGETGKSQVEYYFDSGELIFAFDFQVYYNRPIYWDEEAAMENGDDEVFDPKKSIVEENRYYFKNEKIFLWINNMKEKEDLTKGTNTIIGQSIKSHCYKIRDQLGM